MAFFKFRKSADESTSTSFPPQSIEAVRQRAKYRLVGASVLVLLGVIGFPLLFDKEPRPIAVDTPIDIPDRHKVAPLVLPAAPVVPQAEAVVSAPEAAQRPVSAVVPGQPLPAAKAINQAEIIETVLEKNTPIAPASKASVAIKNIASEASKQAKPGASATVPAKPAKAAISAAASAAPAKPTEAAKALALLEGKAADVPPVVAAGRFVVQVGAFAEVVRAREARLKVEQAGLKTYTQVAETKDGKRIRVRVGPFATKAEAEKAADKIKKLNLPAALLTL